MSFNMLKRPKLRGPVFALHTMACAVLHVIFWIEIVEGKDRPPQLGPLLHVEAHGKLCGLVLRAAETIKGSNRVIGMDSGFAMPNRSTTIGPARSKTSL
jgi:hypothetical protein